MTSPIDTEKLAPSGSGARLPALGSPELSPEFLAKVKEILETLLGRRGGSNWDRAVTFRDLAAAGVALPGFPSATGSASGGLPSVVSEGVYQQLLTRFEQDLRNSPAFKDLVRQIGGADDLAIYPEEIRMLLQQSLADVARARQADIQTLERKIQTSGLSVASRLTEITASLNNTAAGVRQVNAAYADQLQALALSLTQVTARLDDVGGVTVEEKLLAQADSINGLLGQWSIKIQAGTEANPIFAGISLSVEDPVAGPGTSSLIFLAEKFGFFSASGNVMPFGIDGATGKVYINGTLLVNAGGTSLDDMTAGMLNYVGEFGSAPAVAGFNINDVYKNLTDGNSYILNLVGGVKTWVVWLQKGAPGTPGAPGAPGTPGTNGQRGTVDIAASGNTSWSDSAAAAAISGAGYGSPVNRDRVTLYGTGFSETRFYNSGSWLTIAAYINGNMLVSGTLSASQITTGTLSADRISGGTITGASINIGSGNFQVSGTGFASLFGASLTRCTATNSGLPTAAALTAQATGAGNGPGLSVSSENGNAITITGGGNGISQTGGGANFLFSINPVADNTYNLGTSGLRWANVYVASGVISTSDARTKTDVTDTDLGLDFIAALRPVKYRQAVAQNVVTFETVEIEPAREFVDDYGNTVQLDAVTAQHQVVTPRAGVRTHYGLIAQEVRAALQDAGADDAACWTLADPADPESQQALRYEELIAPLIRAVQELQGQVAALQQQVAALGG